jgi:hypothetical protein
MRLPVNTTMGGSRIRQRAVADDPSGEVDAFSPGFPAPGYESLEADIGSHESLPCPYGAGGGL